MSCKARHLLSVLALILAFILCISVLHIAIEAGHDCVGVSCVTCKVINSAIAVLQKVLYVIIAFALACLVFSAFFSSNHSGVITFKLTDSKVKLSC